MSDDLFRKTYPVTNSRHRDQLMLTSGMRLVIDALKETESKLPGMVMAIAIAEGVAASEQVRLSGTIYREAAKAGADLSTVSAIYTEYAGDDLVMIVESEAPAP